MIIMYCFITVNAQENSITISGKIMDSSTSQPLPFTSIYIKDKQIGTTSNQEGMFIFHISSAYKNDTIVISSIGYESLERKAIDFKPHQIISLRLKATDLDEVLISSSASKKLTAKQIVKKAYQSIPNNYPNKPYILEGFVRDLQKENDQYVAYLECASKFYYQPTHIAKEPAIELIAVRKNYINQKHPWNEQWERKNSIIDLIEDDFIRFSYGPILGKNGWKYELEQVVPYDNRYLYKINAIKPPFQKANLFIDTVSFAFVKIELTRKAYKGKSWKRRLTSGEEQLFYNVIVEYQEYNKKMFLKYQKEEDTWQIYDTKKPNTLLFTKNPKKELFINTIITDSVEQYAFHKNLDIGISIENQSQEDNPEFWSTYNAPQKTKELSKIERYLKASNRQ